MNTINIIFISISILLSIVSFFPLIKFTHWIFRFFDFIRFQLLIILSILFIIGLIFFNQFIPLNFITSALLLIAIIQHLIVLLPYLRKTKLSKSSSHSISLLSINVYQYNEDYQRLINLVKKINPDILLTMESDKKWENELNTVENILPNTIKAPHENTYGMHLYTKLKIADHNVHYLISDDRPSIEAKLIDTQGQEFKFWGVHPPPPSPTEHQTSKQKDAELMKIAKKVKDVHEPTIISGDFNQVCWSRTSKLFSKTSNLNDARLGKGIHGTFPVRPKFFRFPLDLLYHSDNIQINELKILSDIGSDHLPIFSLFTIQSENRNSTIQETEKEMDEAEQIIKEGEKEENEE